MERKVIHGILGTLLILTLIGGIFFKYNQKNKISYDTLIAIHRFENDVLALTSREFIPLTVVKADIPKLEVVPAAASVVVKETEPENLYYGMTDDEMDLLYAVVQQEGGPYYDSAVAVMSTIVNRVNNLDKWGWAGETIIDQITYPMQYCYSLDDYWVQYVGNADEEVKQAVWDVLTYGAVYDYDCFRGYYLEDCEQIYDNWYFIG